MPSLIGNKPNQVSTNGDLGRLAFMDNLDSFTSKTVMDTDITNIAPSLNLDFANSKVLDPRITFTRASTATFYNGTSSAKAEENLLLQSVDMANAVYIQTLAGVASVPTKTANFSVAPDGTTTAARYQLSLNGGTASGDFVGFLQSYNFGSAVTATYSVWIKSTDGTSTYDAQIISPTAAGTAVAITGTWQRFTVTATSLATVVSYGVRLRGAATPTNSNTADILVWGAQLEQRSAVTAYTPTTTAAITNYIPTLQTAASGVPRFDHNPITGESLGLLIEEQRTNLLTYSEDLSNAAWTKTNATVTANTIIAPDGTLTGDRLTADGTNTQHYVSVLSSFPSGSSHTLSCSIKKDTANFAHVLVTGINAYVQFSLTDGSIVFSSAGTGTGVSFSVVRQGNGWWRVTLTATQSTGSSVPFRFYPLTNSSNTAGPTEASTASCFIWGAQLEAGSFATSYIPTVASQVTRSPDAASMTGTNFSSWYNNAEGTLYAESASPLSGSSGFSRAFIISDNSVSNFISAGTATSQVRTAGVFQADLGTTQVANTFYKVAVGVKTNDVAVSYNGAAVQTDTSVVLPRVNQAQIGGLETNLGNGVIRKVAYYPRRLSNEELREMTA
jgi:hypothetical protein